MTRQFSLLLLTWAVPVLARRRLEPPAGRTLHAAGQEAGAFESYSSFMGSLGPSVSMCYFGDFNALNSTTAGTPNPWFTALRDKLDADGAPDGAFILPQLGLQLPLNGGEAAVADGRYDAALETLRLSLLVLERPVFLRVGYEFNGQWNGYAPASYIGAFRRIAGVLHGDPTLNASVALVWDGSCDTSRDPTPFFPGDDVVDWEGVNIFRQGSAPVAKPQSCLWYWLTDSRAGGYPLMIGESTPRGLYTQNASTWDAWHAPYLEIVTTYAPALISYIDENWEAVPRWKGWGDSRIEAFAPQLGDKWKAAVGEPQFANRMGRAQMLALLGVPADLWASQHTEPVRASVE